LCAETQPFADRPFVFGVCLGYVHGQEIGGAREFALQGVQHGGRAQKGPSSDGSGHKHERAGIDERLYRPHRRLQ